MSYVVKRRTRKACDLCNIKRTKCGGGDPCTNCSRTDLECTYNRVERKRGRASERYPKVRRKNASKATPDSQLHTSSMEYHQEGSILLPFSTSIMSSNTTYNRAGPQTYYGHTPPICALRNLGNMPFQLEDGSEAPPFRPGGFEILRKKLAYPKATHRSLIYDYKTSLLGRGVPIRELLFSKIERSKESFFTQRGDLSQDLTKNVSSEASLKFSESLHKEVYSTNELKKRQGDRQGAERTYLQDSQKYHQRGYTYYGLFGGESLQTFYDQSSSSYGHQGTSPGLILHNMMYTPQEKHLGDVYYPNSGEGPRPRYLCLEPVIGLLKLIGVSPDLADSLLEHYFASPSPPGLVAPVLRPASFLVTEETDRHRMRSSSQTLLLSMLLVAILDFDLPFPVQLSARQDIYERLSASVTALLPLVKSLGTLDDAICYIHLAGTTPLSISPLNAFTWWKQLYACALSLRLNEELIRDSEGVRYSSETREERRRVFWLVYFMDLHVSFMCNMRVVSHSENISLDALHPCSDESWLDREITEFCGTNAIPGESASLDETSSLEYGLGEIGFIQKESGADLSHLTVQPDTFGLFIALSQLASTKSSHSLYLEMFQDYLPLRQSIRLYNAELEAYRDTFLSSDYHYFKFITGVMNGIIYRPSSYNTAVSQRARLGTPSYIWEPAFVMESPLMDFRAVTTAPVSGQLLLKTRSGQSSIPDAWVIEGVGHLEKILRADPGLRRHPLIMQFFLFVLAVEVLSMTDSIPQRISTYGLFYAEYKRYSDIVVHAIKGLTTTLQCPYLKLVQSYCCEAVKDVSRLMLSANDEEPEVTARRLRRRQGLSTYSWLGDATGLAA
ncbi:hypothetical protein BABINDRAFT_165741 [Babjeviella inositovora NRRL Y-12698]|uniref:Zn(2)-C6 fungal-type domain-containing protein n=1 Tax=Babjeviella inositovora NRRL Y-12698 TaxID=984486 RepID=A0A1E3QVM6_9ASCO|nr:uncharacterized protein BABINDRAFT_165741 [Babjeviella inositovora NRRL Y-12698]ODQ81017.1 hypothetical protein BABINDRAFT_165741 [Babjeviella inositovora NRRL Y-12698]